MKIPKLLENMAIISQLGDNPGSDDNLSAADLKAKFDEGPQKLKTFINDVLIPTVEEHTPEQGPVGPMGPQGPRGIQGPQGIPGEKGEPGISPNVNMVETDYGYEMIITSERGAYAYPIYNGIPGEKGEPGISPIAKVTQTESGAEISITDKDGTTTATVENGKDGCATRNWLDNSYFINPVNSIGLTAASNHTCIDRWESGSGDYTMEIRDDGIAITGECDTFIRTDKSLLGKKVTVALHGYHYLDLAFIQEFTLIASGTVPEHLDNTSVCSASNAYIKFDLVANADQSKLALALIGKNFDMPATLQWAALYVGEYTAETLPEYQYKGYGVEQLECLGYPDKTEIAEMAAGLVEVPTDDHINQLINTALGVIENGTY